MIEIILSWLENDSNRLPRGTEISRFEIIIKYIHDNQGIRSVVSNIGIFIFHFFFYKN